MFAMLMITFREGVEAFLVAAITFTFLQKTGRQHLAGAAKSGVVAALVLSAILGLVLFRVGGMSPLAEGWLALLAGALVVSCTWHMLRHGKAMAGEIRNRLSKVSDEKAVGPWLAVFAFVLLMVGREGIEAATMIASLAAGAATGQLALGGVLGLACAGMLAWAWSRYGRRVNLSLFFQVTAIFMVLFSIQLAIYAVHEFSEAGALPLVNNELWHNVTEPYYYCVNNYSVFRPQHGHRSRQASSAAASSNLNVVMECATCRCLRRGAPGPEAFG